MVDLQKLHERIIFLIDRRIQKMILIDSARTPYDQFVAYRRLFLDEFGRHGLKADISALFFEAELALAIEIEREIAVGQELKEQVN